MYSHSTRIFGFIILLLLSAIRIYPMHERLKAVIAGMALGACAASYATPLKNKPVLVTSSALVGGIGGIAAHHYWYENSGYSIGTKGRRKCTQGNFIPFMYYYSRAYHRKKSLLVSRHSIDSNQCASAINLSEHPIIQICTKKDGTENVRNIFVPLKSIEEKHDQFRNAIETKAIFTPISPPILHSQEEIVIPNTTMPLDIVKEAVPRIDIQPLLHEEEAHDDDMQRHELSAQFQKDVCTMKKSVETNARIVYDDLKAKIPLLSAVDKQQCSDSIPYLVQEASMINIVAYKKTLPKHDQCIIAMITEEFKEKNDKRLVKFFNQHVDAIYEQEGIDFLERLLRQNHGFWYGDVVRRCRSV